MGPPWTPWAEVAEGAGWSGSSDASESYATGLLPNPRKGQPQGLGLSPGDMAIFWGSEDGARLWEDQRVGVPAALGCASAQCAWPRESSRALLDRYFLGVCPGRAGG